MSLVNVARFPFPDQVFTPYESGTFTSALIDAVNEKYAAVFLLPETGTITDADFISGTVTTGSTLNITLETVDATTGMPTGTLYHANATGTAVVTATTDNNKIISTGFGGGTAWGSFTGTKNDLVALVIGQPGASAGNCNIRVPYMDAGYNFPYVCSYIGTPSWAKTGGRLSVALSYGGTYYPLGSGIFPHYDKISTVFHNATTNKEYGNQFIVPFKCRVVGVRIVADLDATDQIVTMYDASNNTLASISFDKDQIFAYGGGSGQGGLDLIFSSPVTVNADTTLYVGIKPQGGTSSYIFGYTILSASHIPTLPYAQHVKGHHRTTQGSGTWVEDTLTVYRISLIIDQLDDGRGGGRSSISIGI